jgi:hypothetical protein
MKWAGNKYADVFKNILPADKKDQRRRGTRPTAAEGHYSVFGWQ